jgi:hypothetical protein
MKHIVNASSGRQGKADHDIVDQLGDAVWPEEVWLELTGDSLGKGRRRTLPEKEERLVTHPVFDVAVHLVIVQLLHRLSLFQLVVDVGHELCTLL